MNHQGKATMGQFTLITMAVMAIGVTAYIPHEKDHFLTDVILREVVDRMSKDFADDTGTYLDFPETNRIPLGAMMRGRNVKDLETEEQQFPMDYDPLGDAGNPNPSIRDQEYLQHSSLWGHQYVAGGAGEGKQHLKPDGTVKNTKEVKTDAALPAYCNPPNPCPVGYAVEDGCLEQFENTAGFSREYQGAQDCMCDSEHMFDCPSSIGRVIQSPADGNELSDTDLDRIMQQIQVEDQHRSSVAKKFHIEKDGNPFLRGEKLPVAAKKGIDVVY
ncbi:uncharacterized protein LOC110829891 isoform X2 [Zootermopsis nevadensis]|uniref:uncharacterized protein LOC110829891 isoform X2 n=1 Tax=Zootermopsis nevadensis TaxID=136037 RepID=UPI000B8E7C67|nr:uncharacterized protein LOC110829891 isoform X2 [Zootermopsis nevadensis]